MPDDLLAEPLDLAKIADWVVQTCLVFGCTLSTAHIVAGYFIRDLDPAWRNPRKRAR